MSAGEQRHLRRPWWGRIAALCGVLSLGCQSYEAGVQTLCDAPRAAQLERAAPDVRFRLMADYIDGAVSNGRVETMFADMAVKAPADKLADVEAAMKEAGLTECLFADELRKLVATSP